MDCNRIARAMICTAEMTRFIIIIYHAGNIVICTTLNLVNILKILIVEAPAHIPIPPRRAYNVLFNGITPVTFYFLALAPKVYSG